MALTWDERSFDKFNGGRGMREYATLSWWRRKCRGWMDGRKEQENDQRWSRQREALALRTFWSERREFHTKRYS